MKEGGLKPKLGCGALLAIWFIAPVVLALAAVPFLAVYNAFQRFGNGQIKQGFFELIVSSIIISVYAGVFLLVRKLKGGSLTLGKKSKITSPNGVELRLQKGNCSPHTV